MKVQIPYGTTSLQVGTMYVYSLKLRFNAASWSWLEPEIQELGVISSLIAVSNRNGFHTVSFQTTQYEQFAELHAAINRGQLAQQEELLRLWKECGYRRDAKYCFREELSVAL